MALEGEAFHQVDEGCGTPDVRMDSAAGEGEVKTVLGRKPEGDSTEKVWGQVVKRVWLRVLGARLCGKGERFTFALQF